MGLCKESTGFGSISRAACSNDRNAWVLGQSKSISGSTWQIMNEKGGTTMKTYENPELEIVRFTTEDVITTSGDDGNIDLPPLPADWWLIWRKIRKRLHDMQNTVQPEIDSRKRQQNKQIITIPRIAGNIYIALAPKTLIWRDQRKLERLKRTFSLNAIRPDLK